MRAMTVFVAAYLISASLLAAEPVARSARDCPVAGQEARSSLPVLARDLRSKNAFLPSAIGFDSDGLRGLQTSGQTKGNIATSYAEFQEVASLWRTGMPKR